jgi:hypothetical protein
MGPTHCRSHLALWASLTIWRRASLHSGNRAKGERREEKDVLSHSPATQLALPGSFFEMAVLAAATASRPPPMSTYFGKHGFTKSRANLPGNDRRPDRQDGEIL